MNKSVLSKRLKILARVPKPINKNIEVSGRLADSVSIQRINTKGFAPVEISDLPQADSNQIEVIFPNGIHVILSGPQSVSSLATLLKQGL